MTRAERLEEIRKRAEAATPGPRKFEPTWFQHECSWGVAARSITTGDVGPDLAFYSAAREDIPWLLEEAARQKNLLELAWGVIANANGGDWTQAGADWQEAAARWRDEWLKP